MIRLAILADQRTTADDFAHLLAFEDRIEVLDVGVIGPPPRRPASAADVLLAVKLLSAQLPKTPLPIIAVSEDPGAPPPGVHAWLPLGSSPQSLVAAIVAAAAGLYTLTADQLHFPAPEELDPWQLETLTSRELEVLNLMAEGLGNKLIADRLNISGHTAKSHVAHILAKLRAGTRTEAVRIGFRRGLIAL